MNSRTKKIMSLVKSTTRKGNIGESSFNESCGSSGRNNDSRAVKSNSEIIKERVASNTPKSTVQYPKNFDRKMYGDIQDDQDCEITENHVALKVATSESSTKRHFCCFCEKLQTKLARHLELKHRSENEVLSFLSLPKKSTTRMKIITDIRKRGDFIYNTNSEKNQGEIIVVRRPNMRKNRKASDFISCGNCGAMYSKNTLSTHYRSCKRLSLSEWEKKVVEDKAKYYLDNLKYPTIEFCSRLINTEPALRKRRSCVIKAYIINAIKRREQNIITSCTKTKRNNGLRKFWSDEEKTLVRNLFAENFTTKKLPSLSLCAKVIKESIILQNRTPVVLKAFIHNNFKKNQPNL